MLPSDQYSNTTPHFEYAIRDDMKYQATVYLPMNFPLEEKIYKVSLISVSLYTFFALSLLYESANL